MDDSQVVEVVPQSPLVSREQSPIFSLQPASREQSPEGDFSLDFFTQIPNAAASGSNNNNNNINSSINSTDGSFVRDSMEGTDSGDGISSQAGSAPVSLRSASDKRNWNLVKAAKKTVAYLTGSQSQPPTHTQKKSRAASIRSVRTTQSSQSTRTTRSMATGLLERAKGKKVPY